MRNHENSRNQIRDAAWLAKRDVRSSWASFPATVVAVFALGLLSTAQYRNAFGGEMDVFGGIMLDFFLLAIVAVMSVNLLFNRDYFNEMSDESFNGRLSFLRSMPVSAKSVVLGRVVSMSFALACAVPTFFLAPYLVYGGLREAIGFGDYVWYFGMWLGYAILAMGGFVFCNFAFNWKIADTWLPATTSLLAFYGLAVAASNALLDGGLSLTLIEIAKTTSGPLAAAISISAGTCALAAFAAISGRRLEKRDIG